MGLFTKWRNKEELTSARMNRMLDEIENKLNELNQVTLNLDRSVKTRKYTEMTVQDVNNANYPFSYETDINFGRQIGLPTDWAFIKHFKHSNNNGYCTQIAYKLAPSNENVSDSLNWSIKIRKSTALEWTPWEEIHTSGSGNLYTITDANDAIENGKIYLCRYQQCRNIPFNNDGMILAFNYNRNLQAGFQIWVSWHDDCICYRSFIGTFRPWKRLTAVNP